MPPIYHRHDQFTKNLLHDALIRAGGAPKKGRVGGGRGGRRTGESLVPTAFAILPVPQSVHCSVSRRRSSNRTCGVTPQ
jgi:hypothetical protein